jgi:MYXO-CTERM domain-containing protein
MRSEQRRFGLAITIAIGLGLAALLPARTASAFCRTATCGKAGTGQNCVPVQPGDCGISLFWASPCVGYSIQQDASSKVSFAATEKIMKASFAAWEGATCAGGTPHIAATELAAAECAKHEYNQEKGNTNLIVFRDDAWPYEGSSNTLALTTVTYNLDTGEIYDADMEVNSHDNDLTTSDTGAVFDVQSITTHEAGHFLGLAHSATATATMFPAYQQHDLELRSLDPDDILGICAIYPPGAPIPATCDTTPRHGFSTLCGAEQPAPATSSGCSCRIDGGPLPASAAGIAAAMAALGGVARRRSRERERARARRQRARASEGAPCR